MWTNWNANRGISEEARSIRTEYDGLNRSLQGSHTGSFSVEFDIEAGVYSDRSSEVGTGRTTPIDWVADLLSVRNRLEEQKKQDGGQRDPEPRAPSPYENFESLEMQMEKLLEPDTPNIPKIPSNMVEKYADTYELERYKKNAMIIFNHKDFLGGNNTREGTMEDEAALKTTFEMFNFEVESHLNSPKKQLLQELKTFCSKDFREYGCVCVAILTHGSRHGYLKAFDTRYSEHEIIERFDVLKNPSLCGKPIIILIQACRGVEPATACNPDSPKLEKDIELDNENDDHYDLPTESDMVIFHSSYVGRASAREVRNGSWFIQTLCEQIRLLSALEDFESICRAVRQKVALDKEHKMFLNSKSIVAKQMPVLTCTLLRRLYLRKYEDVAVDNKVSEKKEVVEEGTVLKAIAKVAQEKREFSTKNARICGCDGYFEYMKKCLTIFIKENPEDEVAISIMRIAGNVGKMDGDNNKYAMTNLIRNYLVQNAERFKYSDVVYFGHSRNCHTRSHARNRLVTCCSIL